MQDPRHRWMAISTAAFLAAVLFFFFWIRLQPVPMPVRTNSVEPGAPLLSEPTVSFVNPKKGAADPKLIIVEFGDFQCEPCKQLAETLDVVVRTIPEVQVVWRNMPNEDLHPLATPAAIAAHCAADQGRFWEMHDLLFQNQVTLSETLFPVLAEELGLDVEQFTRCYDTRETLPLVKHDFEEALALKITATPTLFIGEERIVGAVTASSLLQRVNQLLLEP